ncbi:MAG: hypothetical protein MK538_04570 [Planctomycetes bacterium]|nr:hypothetical protein [Planctomycetota bacterium]
MAESRGKNLRLARLPLLRQDRPSVVPSARYVFVVPLHNCADDTTLNDLGNQPPSATGRRVI